MYHTLATLLLIMLCAVHVGTARGDDGRQKAMKAEINVPVKFDYLLYRPADYDKQDKWPLLLFLHGAGERGSDLEKVKKHGPPKLIEAGKDFPFVVVSPQCPDNHWWQAPEVAALLDSVVAQNKIDPDRIYVTGLSMGGFGTWALAGFIPDKLAAILPICGGGETIAASRLRNVPAWAFHGAKDPVVTLDRSEKMVEALKKAGGDVKLTVYPDALHDSWTATYENPEIYTWLLDHKRKSKDAK